MSTKVNITVGNNALIASSKQQQVANRQGQLEKESRKELKDRALAANADLRAALGKDLNGQPIYGAQLPIPEIYRRPAANRQEQSKVGMIWQTVNISDNTTEATPGLEFIDSISPLSRGTSEGAGGPNGSLTVEYNFLSGSGTTSVFDYTKTLTNVPYPINGYIWNPTMGYADDDGGAFPTINYAYAYGPRTSRYTTISTDFDQRQVVLPIGKGEFILLRAVVDGSISPITIDVTADYLVIKNISTVPLNQRGLETVFAEELLPGAAIYMQTGAFIVDLEGGGTEVIVPEPMTPIVTVNGTLATVSSKAYFCSNKTVREITPVGMLVDILDFITPEIVYIEYTVLGQTVPIPRYRGKPGSFALTTYSQGLPATPNIYRQLNDIFNYTDPVNLITSTDIIYRDTTAGSAFSEGGLLDDAYQSSLPLRHVIRRYNPSLQTYRTNYVKFKTSPDRDLNAVISKVYGAYTDVWDWDNPRYCRARLADLGVQPSAWLN